MKSVILLIVLLTTVAFTQTPNWTTVKETNINFGSALSFDQFTNSAGNHIIIQESSALKYYKMNINGQAGTPITLESASVVSPSISGDATKLYVVYRKSNEDYIRTKYSNDGGANWSYVATLNYNANSIESVFSNNNLHVTFQVGSSVYYSKYNGSFWTSPFTVSSTETGTSPRIAAWKDADEDKVYFIYRNSITTGKFREYNVTSNQWGNIYTGYALNPSNLSASAPAGFTVGNDYLYYYYSYTTSSPYTIYFQYRILTKTGSLISESYPEPNETYRIHTTTTFNGTSYAAFWYNYYIDQENDPGLYRAKNLGTQFYSFDQIYWNINQQPVYYPPVNISSAGNETHVIWKDNLGSNNGNNLRYIYDDQNPLAPQGLDVQPYQQGSTTVAKLTWQLNNEPDVFIKESNAYQIERRIKLMDDPWGSWTLVYTPGGSVTEFIDYEVQGAGSERYYAEYRMRAIDYNNHYSSYSSSVMIGFSKYSPNSPVGGNLNSANKINNTGVNDLSYDYMLAQNYPNPFNPLTTIEYSIKSAGMVTLKVYDMLGNEVANLVNERNEPGNYSVTFDAGSLPSGIYVYKLTSGNFVATKKLILLK